MIGVTAARGGVGSRVLRQLGPDAVGLTRPHADYEDPAGLRRAFAGIDTLVFVSSDGIVESVRRHHENVIAAAVDAGVEHIVYTSIIDIAPDSRFYYAAVHRDTEALLAQSGLRHCLARTSIFADYFASEWLRPAVAVPAGTGRMSLVTRDDVAGAVAAAARSRREGVLNVTGPEALTAAEIAAIAGVPHEPIDEAEYRRRMAGEPDWLIEAYTSMFRSVREGRFALVSPDAAPQQSFADFLIPRS